MFSSAAEEYGRAYQKATKKDENGADVKKSHPEKAEGYKCTKSITKSIRAAVPASGATIGTILKNYKSLSLLCHPDKRVREIILQGKNIIEDEKARSIYVNMELKKQKSI